MKPQKGDVVICKENYGSLFKKGNKYRILNLASFFKNIEWVRILGEGGGENDDRLFALEDLPGKNYFYKFFLSKSEERKLKLETLKNDSTKR